MIVLSAKSFLAYAGLPRFRLRLQELFMSGFQFIAHFMALVYAAVNLLPANHPYTLAQNIGKFGIRHVVGEAANHLVLKKENIDQIILFIALLVGMALIFMQLLTLAVGMFIQPVLAMPTTWQGFFVTADPSRDIAHIMMDLVFGIPANSAGDHFFNSCIAQEITCQQSNPEGSATADRDVMVVDDGAGGSTSIFADYGYPFPIHRAMHSMFQMYNIGLLVVAAMITAYFIFTVVAETAQTGTAFGKRFNKVWAPVRIVFAIGMLVPVGFGFNGSQFAVLYAAKFGSAFATNGWTLFNTELSTAYGGAVNSLFGDEADLVTTPNIPELRALLQFMFTARTCKYAEEGFTSAEDLFRYGSGAGPGFAAMRDIRMFAVRGSPLSGSSSHLEVSSGTTYDALLDFMNGTTNEELNTTVTIRFGRQHSVVYPQYKGNVRPYCGEVVLKLTDPKTPGSTPAPEPGLVAMQTFYWDLIKDLWFDTFEGSAGSNTGMAAVGAGQVFPENIADVKTFEVDTTPAMPYPEFNQEIYDEVRDAVEEALTGGSGGGGGALQLIQDSDRYEVNNLVREKGWAGTAVWYNRIAEMNGAITTAVLNVPYPTLYPDVMEHVHRKKKLLNQDVSFENRYDPFITEEEVIHYRRARDAQIMNGVHFAYNHWQKDSNAGSSHAAPTGNAMIDSINAVFGTEGLYNIRRNPDSHPLAQLVGVGRSLVEASIRNLTLSVAGGSAAQLFGFLDSVKTVASIQSKFLITVTMVSLTAGFILFYIVPFLPFIYFFFAVGGWIKGIFEAMVGAPLWALAHIRIDGNGLPGQAGVAGYFLIFEIFIRPILIVFGMLASISIFSALVSVLHQTFDLVTANVGGFDHRLEIEGEFTAVDGTAVSISGTGAEVLDYARSAVDEFFFTIIYTIIIYLMAMSSFKLIDLIPNNILRWMGQSVATFNDQREDAAQGMVGKATVGAQQTSSALGGGLNKIAGVR